VKQFSGAKKWLNDLDSDTAAKLITVASDVALVVSDAQQGIIVDVSLGSDALSSDHDRSMAGQSLAGYGYRGEPPQGRGIAPRFEQGGSAALANGQPYDAGGADLPVMYAAVK